MERVGGSVLPSTVALSFAGVGKRFATGTVALDGVDLELARGEFVSVVGPSGCGKSTPRDLRFTADFAELAVRVSGALREDER